MRSETKELKVNKDKEIENDKYDPTNFIDMLLKNKVTWHIGGMCDPFQPIEEKYCITAQLIELMKKYNYSGLFSTKSDTIYNAEPDPTLHNFQLSITSSKSNDIEPGVPSIESRYKFFNDSIIYLYI